MSAIRPKISVVIPAFNEEASIGLLVADIPRNIVDEVIVVDNGSTDKTAAIAKSKGATVVREERRGYGRACATGVEKVSQDCDIVVFMDGDYADHPEEMPNLINPISRGDYDLVIGSRIRGNRENGSMTSTQVFGSWLSSFLIKLAYGYKYTDLGPFRAIRYQSLQSLGMSEMTYGWSIEMQVKAIQRGLRVLEVPVNYRCRIGQSKVSGTIQGSIRAGFRILWTIARLVLKSSHSSNSSPESTTQSSPQGQQIKQPSD